MTHLQDKYIFYRAGNGNTGTYSINRSNMNTSSPPQGRVSKSSFFSASNKTFIVNFPLLHWHTQWEFPCPVSVADIYCRYFSCKPEKRQFVQHPGPTLSQDFGRRVAKFGNMHTTLACPEKLA